MLKYLALYLRMAVLIDERYIAIAESIEVLLDKRWALVGFKILSVQGFYFRLMVQKERQNVNQFHH